MCAGTTVHAQKQAGPTEKGLARKFRPVFAPGTQCRSGLCSSNSLAINMPGAAYS